MELTIKLENLDYVQVLDLVLPMVRQKDPRRSDGMGRLITAILNVPQETLRPVLEAIDPREFNGIVSALVQEYEALLLEKAGAVLQQQGIALRLRRLELSPELRLRAQITDVDYVVLADKFLPLLLRDGRDNGIWSQVLKAPKFLVKTILSSTPASKLEEGLAHLVNGNADRLCRMLETQAAKYGLTIQVRELRLES